MKNLSLIATILLMMYLLLTVATGDKFGINYVP